EMDHCQHSLQCHLPGSVLGPTHIYNGSEITLFASFFAIFRCFQYMVWKMNPQLATEGREERIQTGINTASKHQAAHKVLLLKSDMFAELIEKRFPASTQLPSGLTIASLLVNKPADT
ncbi:hypothetical protein A6R68_21991, partial [Neotoma lepida]